MLYLTNKYSNKMRLHDKLKEQSHFDHFYLKIAKEFNTSLRFVWMIALGERQPQRGKGLKIKERLEQIVKETENQQSITN